MSDLLAFARPSGGSSMRRETGMFYMYISGIILGCTTGEGGIERGESPLRSRMSLRSRLMCHYHELRHEYNDFGIDTES